MESGDNPATGPLTARPETASGPLGPPDEPPTRGAGAPGRGHRPVARGAGSGRHLWRWRWPRWLPPPKVVLVAVIVVGFGLLLYRIRGDLVTALRRMGPGGLPWLVVAIAAEAVSFLCYAGVQRMLLAAGGARLRRRTVVSLTVAATGLTNLLPGGTAPASGWLVNQYRRHGVPLPLALWTVLAGGFAAGVSVVLLLVCGTAIAGLLGLWPTLGLLAALVGVAVAGVVAAHHMPAVLAWLAEDRRLPGLEVARRIVYHAGTVAQFRATVPGGVAVYALSILNWLLDVLVLATAFLVLDMPVPWRALLFAYAAAQVAGSLAPVPGGIGFVEGGMIGAFALAGIPTGNAVVATVIYRLVTTLGMAGIGTAALFFVNHREPQAAQLHGDAAAIARAAGAESRGAPGEEPAGAEPAGEPGEGAPGAEPADPDGTAVSGGEAGAGHV